MGPLAPFLFIFAQIKSNMIVKQVEFGAEAREKLVSGIDIIANAVKSTLGARGQTVLIESDQYTHGIHITKDGVSVARSIVLDDPTQNLAVQMVKEASEKTATAAGDGTTTSIVLVERGKGSCFVSCTGTRQHGYPCYRRFYGLCGHDLCQQ